MKNLMTIAIALAFGSTVAVADSHSEKKKAPDAAKKEEPKKDAAKKEAPKKMEAPKPPKEIEDMAKATGGNWKCTGKAAMDPADPTKWTEITGTSKSALELDKWWIKSDYVAKVSGMTMKGTMYTTFDGKKWYRHSMDSMGNSDTAAAPAPAAGGKIIWEGESRMNGAVTKMRTTEELGAKEMKVTSEGSPDGKKWVAMFEMTCKK
jgi:hypothetical protein